VMQLLGKLVTSKRPKRPLLDLKYGFAIMCFGSCLSRQVRGLARPAVGFCRPLREEGQKHCDTADLHIRQLGYQTSS
jgi:hypothetical protein